MSSAERETIRLLIVDDHAIVREGLRMIIESCAQFKIIGEAGNRIDALSAAACEQPDVILLDLLLGDENGLELIPELLVASRHARILVVTGLNNPEEQYRSMRMGAMGVVLKNHAPETLIRAIESVHAGEVWLEHAMTVRLLSEMLNGGETEKADPELSKIAKLTAREREVVSLVGECLRNKQIAERLFISEVTVRHHLTSIFNKLELTDRLELAMYAYQYGLAKPPFYGSRLTRSAKAG
jgi:DNA-binding NarL/FixJ family response regulator